MLVHADAVVAELRGQLQLIKVVVVSLVPQGRVVELGRDIDVDAAVVLLEVVREVGIRHEVEAVCLHGRLLAEYGRSLLRERPL
jgi:hypothetical protein